MAFLFGRAKTKNIPDMVRSTKDLLTRLVIDEKLPPKSEADLAANLTSMKIVLQGTPEVEASPDQVYQLCDLLVKEDLLQLLASNIYRLPFEARKDTQTIVSCVFRYKQPGDPSADPIALQYVVSRQPEIIIALCNGYDKRESAMPCGGILKEALKFDAVTALILYHEPTEDGKMMDLDTIDTSKPASGKGVLWKFFDWIDKSLFEVSTDAFDTFRQVLIRHKSMSSKYLSVNFDQFFDRYNKVLVQSDSYVTKRQSIKLLGEILLDRAFYDVMVRYAASGDNLKLAMTHLRDDRKMIQYEGFHVFKIFAAKPDKSPEVQKFLFMNKQKLLNFLPTFLDDRAEDAQFADEKAYLLRLIDRWGSPSSSTSPASATESSKTSLPTTPSSGTSQQSS